MNEPHKIQVVCQVDDLRTDGWVERRDLTKGERMAASGKIFGVFFGIACMTVFVPVLHFILPPLSLLTGGVLAFGEYASTGEILRGEITCPNCKKKIEILHESEDWPRNQRCTGCAFSLKTTPVAGALST